MRATKFTAAIVALLVTVCLAPTLAKAETAKVIEAQVNDALDRLYKENKSALDLSQKAKGILIFPEVTKAGFVIGGSHGVGALRVGGNTDGFYQTTSGSLGLQAGVEKHSEVIMFMTDEALANFRASKNWQAGVDGSIAVLDAGAGGDISTQNQQKPIIAYVFGTSGIYGGVNLEGAKISPYTPE
jgi:lipid-binding SYLF domain-containing protein